MARYSFIALASMAGMVVALPLNINLGAYSPALVVGDGEISFGGNQDVSNLMNVLEGAAVNAATGVANGNTNGAAVVPATNNAGTEPTTPAASEGAAVTDPTVAAAASTASDANLQEQQAQQIAALQGLGKEIAPRMQLVDPEVAVAEDATAAAADKEPLAKRDLSGFDRALTFAEAALEKGPKIQLGTGVEGSGVGIIVDNNKEAAARAGTGAAEKRDLASQEAELSSSPKRVRAKVTTMYVRRGVPASLQSSSVARDVADDALAAAAVRRAPVLPVPASASAAHSAPSRRDAIDAVNLNVDGDQGLTMTFVETVADGEDD